MAWEKDLPRTRALEHNGASSTYGIGWRYVHNPFGQVEIGNERVEIVSEVTFQYCFKPTNDHVGSGLLVWDAQAGDGASTQARPTTTGGRPSFSQFRQPVHLS
jgi:hypothetical protein